MRKKLLNKWRKKEKKRSSSKLHWYTVTFNISISFKNLPFTGFIDIKINCNFPIHSHVAKGRILTHQKRAYGGRWKFCVGVSKSNLCMIIFIRHICKSMVVADFLKWGLVEYFFKWSFNVWWLQGSGIRSSWD